MTDGLSITLFAITMVIVLPLYRETGVLKYQMKRICKKLDKMNGVNHDGK